MLLYIFERQQCGQVSRWTEIEQSGRNGLPWTPNHAGNGQHKMHQTLKTWFKSDTFWKATVCSTTWKLEVYDAIIRNKLLYGLETVHFTQTQQKEMNASQFRGPRKILGLSKKLLSTVPIQTHMYCRRHMRKSAMHLGHPTKYSYSRTH